jgi:hypothetical protein
MTHDRGPGRIAAWLNGVRLSSAPNLSRRSRHPLRQRLPLRRGLVPAHGARESHNDCCKPARPSRVAHTRRSFRRLPQASRTSASRRPPMCIKPGSRLRSRKARVLKPWCGASRCNSPPASTGTAPRRRRRNPARWPQRAGPLAKMDPRTFCKDTGDFYARIWQVFAAWQVWDLGRLMAGHSSGDLLDQVDTLEVELVRREPAFFESIDSRGPR